MLKSQLTIALLALSATNDDDWTAQGLPRIDVISKAVDDTVTREEISAELPSLTRTTIDAIRTEVEKLVSEASEIDESDETEIDQELGELTAKLKPSDEKKSDPTHKNESDVYSEAVKNVEDAKEKCNSAKIKLDRAQKILDVLKTKRAQFEKTRRPAEVISAFNASQLEQRKAQVKKGVMFADFMAKQGR